MRKFVFLFLIVGLVTALLWVVFRSRFQSEFGEYERGFGDTVLRYKDRTYDSAKWEVLKESKSLASFATIDELNTVEFAAIAGWDDSNFWSRRNGVGCSASAMGSGNRSGAPNVPATRRSAASTATP